MIVINRGCLDLKFYTTLGEAKQAARRAVFLIKSLRLHTRWKRGALEPWDRENELYEGNDGVVQWRVWTERGKNDASLFCAVVEMSGADQMCYNWSIPTDGNFEEVIQNCLDARKVNVDGGELWMFLDQL